MNSAPVVGTQALSEADLLRETTDLPRKTTYLHEGRLPVSHAAVALFFYSFPKKCDTEH